MAQAKGEMLPQQLWRKFAPPLEVAPTEDFYAKLPQIKLNIHWWQQGSRPWVKHLKVCTSNSRSITLCSLLNWQVNSGYLALHTLSTLRYHALRKHGELFPPAWWFKKGFQSMSRFVAQQEIQTCLNDGCGKRVPCVRENSGGRQMSILCHSRYHM